MISFPHGLPSRQQGITQGETQSMRIELELSRSSLWISIGKRHLWWSREDGLQLGRDG